MNNISATTISKASSPGLATVALSPAGEPSLLPGVNVLLEGPTGTGKTYTIGTLVETGIETFYLGLEAGIETLFGYFTDRGRPIPENLHWHTLDLSSSLGNFADLATAAAQIGSMTQESLHKMQDFNRHQNNPFERLLRVMNDFSDQRTGQKFGPVDRWGPDRAIVLDGLTGLGNFAMQMVIGQKPVRSQADWGIAQDAVYKYLHLCTNVSKAHFILISHVEREIDQVMGGVKVTVSTLGKALPPKIPPLFSDVVLCNRQGTTWQWNTANNLCDLKTRNLPYSENLIPGFAQIIEKWKSRGGKFSPTVKV